MVMPMSSSVSVSSFIKYGNCNSTDTQSRQPQGCSFTGFFFFFFQLIHFNPLFIHVSHFREPDAVSFLDPLESLAVGGQNEHTYTHTHRLEGATKPE